MSKIKVLAIIPAYNEEKNILNTVRKLREENGSIDYIIINDGSKDKTEQICKEHKLNYITLIKNLGIGGAVQTGYKYALTKNYDIAIQIDGDGQHNPKDIDSLVKVIESGADMSIGSRFIKKEGFQSSFMRRFGSNVLTFVIKILTGKKITDPTSGLRAANRRVIKMFAEYYPADYPEPEVIIRVLKRQYEIKEIPVIMDERKEGKSSITLFWSVYYMVKVTLAMLIAYFSEKVEEKKA